MLQQMPYAESNSKVNPNQPIDRAVADALDPWIKHVLKLLYVHGPLRRRKYLHLSRKRETTLRTMQLVEKANDGEIELTALGRELACELMGRP